MNGKCLEHYCHHIKTSTICVHLAASTMYQLPLWTYIVAIAFCISYSMWHPSEYACTYKISKVPLKATISPIKHWDRVLWPCICISVLPFAGLLHKQQNGSCGSWYFSWLTNLLASSVIRHTHTLEMSRTELESLLPSSRSSSSYCRNSWWLVLHLWSCDCNLRLSCSNHISTFYTPSLE